MISNQKSFLPMVNLVPGLLLLPNFLCSCHLDPILASILHPRTHSNQPRLSHSSPTMTPLLCLLLGLQKRVAPLCSSLLLIPCLLLGCSRVQC